MNLCKCLHHFSTLRLGFFPAFVAEFCGLFDLTNLAVCARLPETVGCFLCFFLLSFFLFGSVEFRTVAGVL